jgi:hypothetical protein
VRLGMAFLNTIIVSVLSSSETAHC